MIIHYVYLVFKRLSSIYKNYEMIGCNKSTCKYREKYNLYHYAVRLFGKTNKTACLMFRNGTFFVNHPG